jgi:hypothetical protein
MYLSLILDGDNFLFCMIEGLVIVNYWACPP